MSAFRETGLMLLSITIPPEPKTEQRMIQAWLPGKEISGQSGVLQLEVRRLFQDSCGKETNWKLKHIDLSKIYFESI